MPRIKNVEDPIDQQDVATKNYVDSASPSPSYAYIYSASGSPNTPVIANTWTKLLCSTTSSFLSVFDTGSPALPNRLRYIGASTINVNASANICCTANVNGFYMGLSIFKNGSIIPGSDLYFPVNNTIFTNISINAFATLTTNDIIEVYAQVSVNATITPLGLNNFLQFSVFQV